MKASKYEMKGLQGLCVLAMIALHLFCRTDYIYSPTLYLFNIPLCYYIGQFGDFCVMGFAFCSAYGHCAILEKSPNNYYKGRVKSILQLLITFWTVLCIFSVISILIGNGNSMPGSINTFLGNVFLYRLSYNGAWWYILTYIFLVLTSKPVIKFVYRINYIPAIILLAVIYTIAYYFRFRNPAPFNNVILDECVRQLFLYGMTISEYCIGVLFYKYDILSKAEDIFKNHKAWKIFLILMVLLISAMGRTLFIRSLYVAPVTGMLVIICFHLFIKENRIFHFVGIHSTNMWLTHMFFYEVLFTNFIFYLRYPIVIFAGMVSLTILVSKILKLIQDPLKKIVGNSFKIDVRSLYK